MELKGPEDRGHRGHSSSLMRALSPDLFYIFSSTIFSLCFFFLFTICVMVSIHLTSWLARLGSPCGGWPGDTVENETSLAQDLLSLYPTPLPGFLPQQGPRPRLRLHSQKSAFGFCPNPIILFRNKTHPYPTPPFGTFERPYNGKVTEDRGKPPARLKERRRWGRETRSWAQNGHSGGFFKSCLPFNCLAGKVATLLGCLPVLPGQRGWQAGAGLSDRKELARSLVAEERQREAMGLDLEAGARETSTDSRWLWTSPIGFLGPNRLLPKTEVKPPHTRSSGDQRRYQ